MLIDVHTHKKSEGADLSVVNLYPEDVALSGSHIYSCGIHPWYIQEEKVKEWLSHIEQLCRQQKIVAIGECGLDKNSENIKLQKDVLKAQIKLSEQYKLPVIIHSVKTHHRVLELRKTTLSRQPWIIHGYNGSIETLKQFARQNIFVSFGEKLIRYPDKMQQLLNQVNLDFVLLETDDSDISIVEIYRQFSKLLGMEQEELETKIETNFNCVFK